MNMDEECECVGDGHTVYCTVAPQRRRRILTALSMVLIAVCFGATWIATQNLKGIVIGLESKVASQQRREKVLLAENKRLTSDRDEQLAKLERYGDIVDLDEDYGTESPEEWCEMMIASKATEPDHWEACVRNQYRGEPGAKVREDPYLDMVNKIALHKMYADLDALLPEEDIPPEEWCAQHIAAPSKDLGKDWHWCIRKLAEP